MHWKIKIRIFKCNKCGFIFGLIGNISNSKFKELFYILIERNNKVSETDIVANTEIEKLIFCPRCLEFEKLLNKAIKTLVHKTIRFALTGSENGMSVTDAAMMLGRDETLWRLKHPFAVYNYFERTKNEKNKT